MSLFAIAIFALLVIVALELFDRLPRGLAIVATDRYYCGNTAGLWTCTIDRIAPIGDRSIGRLTRSIAIVIGLSHRGQDRLV